MKRKKRSKRATKSAQVAWVQGRGRHTGPPRHVRTDWAPSPDRVMVAIAALVPASHAVEGHAERMRAHAERVAREEAAEGRDVRGTLLCDACGVIARRKGNQGVDPDRYRRPDSKLIPAEQRWKCKKLDGYGFNLNYCPACFEQWGWGDAVTCSDDERGL